MTAVALVSAKGAPGVTTTALLLAALWPRAACLLEADPAGGDLRFWHTGADGQPLRPDIGVVSLLAAHRTGTGAVAGTAIDRSLLAHSQSLAGGLPVLVGAGSPAQHAALGPSWPLLTAGLNHTADSRPAAGIDAGDRIDVIVDAGRLLPDPHQLRLLAAVPLVLVVCRPRLSAVAHTRDTLTALRANGTKTGVLVIGSPAAREETRAALGVDERTVVGQLPDDPTAARALAGEWTRGLDRSPLVAAGRRLAADLHTRLHTSAQPPAAQLPALPDRAVEVVS